MYTITDLLIFIRRRSFATSVVLINVIVILFIYRRAIFCYLLVFREKKPEVDSSPSDVPQGASVEVCRRCLERHVEGVESCMENAYSSRSRYYVPPTTNPTEPAQTTASTTTAPSSTQSLAKCPSTACQNHLTVPDVAAFRRKMKHKHASNVYEVGY